MQNDKTGVRILVVDDQSDMLGMMEMVLSRCGYCVATAQSAREALEIARDVCPHIVISDIGMPGMDGCEMMRVLRRESGTRAFKSIALTGYGLPCDQTRMTESGFDLCLLKPLEFATLIKHIEQMLQEQMLQEQMLEDRADSQSESSPFPHAHDNNSLVNFPFRNAAPEADHEIPRQMAAEH